MKVNRPLQGGAVFTARQPLMSRTKIDTAHCAAATADSIPCLTCGGMNEHSLARLHSSSRTEAGISREEDGRQRASRSRRHVRRDGHHCRADTATSMRDVMQQ